MPESPFRSPPHCCAGRLLTRAQRYRADAVLPRGFDLVVLGKKEREAVKAVGKNPDRREGDIDENSQPVNTELAPLVAPAPEPLPPAEPQPEEQLQALPEEPQPAVLEPAAV